MATTALLAWRSIRILMLLQTLLGDRELTSIPLSSSHTWTSICVERLNHNGESLHTSIVSGKKLAKLFYNATYTKSYYLGCSLGGRQGIKAAEMFPQDFDGIVAGSPALDFNNLDSWRASFYPITGNVNSTNFITASTWVGLIHNEVLSQCDGLDGVRDGIIEDPTLCDFRPESLLCANGTTANCLTDIQVKNVRKIFSPLYGEDGNLIYPAMQPGSEIMAVQKLYAGKPFSYSEVTLHLGLISVQLTDITKMKGLV